MTVRRVLAALAAALACAAAARADAFDLYLNKDLARLTEGKNAREVKRLTPKLLVEHDRVLPRVFEAFVVVKTNGGRYAKLLAHPGKQRAGADAAVPVLAIERFVTYKDGEERTVLASGQRQALYDGFRFSLDLGQVVPEALGGDLRFVAGGGKVYAEPVGKARVFLVTRHDPAVEPKKAGKFVMGEKVEPKHFAGSYRLRDDGRRSGRLVLEVGAGGAVTGAYYSDKDGQKYEVQGKVGPAPHAVEFTVKYPRTEQAFRGMLFTGDGKAIAGTSRLADREFAFYAVREE